MRTESRIELGDAASILGTPSGGASQPRQDVIGCFVAGAGRLAN
jgi:hypothetical protein